MAAVTYDLDIEQGATFTVVFEWREDDGSSPPSGPLINTDNYKAFMQIRSKPGGDLYASFDEDSGLTVQSGVISLRISALTTEMLTKQGVYDIELHNSMDDSDVVRLVSGKVKTTPDITKSGDA